MGISSDEGLRLAISANPNDPFAWYGCGVRCYSKKQYAEALQCFERAEQIKKGFSAANYYYIAVTMSKMGRTRDDICTQLKSSVACRAINNVDRKGRALAGKLLTNLEAGSRRSTSPKLPEN